MDNCKLISHAQHYLKSKQRTLRSNSVKELIQSQMSTTISNNLRYFSTHHTKLQQTERHQIFIKSLFVAVVVAAVAECVHLTTA